RQSPTDSRSFGVSMRLASGCLLLGLLALPGSWLRAEDIKVQEDEQSIRLSTPQLEATIRKRGYVSGVAAQSFLDKKTGFREAGFGLDIVDWIMEPGSDEAYRDRLEKELVYVFGNSYHGKTPKRSIEGPQICTQAKQLDPKVIRGRDFVGVTMDFKYRTAAPGKKAGSIWNQALVFPLCQRYFVSDDKGTSVNAREAMRQRTALPG